MRMTRLPVRSVTHSEASGPQLISHGSARPSTSTRLANDSPLAWLLPLVWLLPLLVWLLPPLVWLLPPLVWLLPPLSPEALLPPEALCPPEALLSLGPELPAIPGGCAPSFEFDVHACVKSSEQATSVTSRVQAETLQADMCR